MNLWIYFVIGLLFTFGMPALFPSLQLFYFIPFLVRACYVRSLSKTLWIALGIGVLLDLYSANSRFGLYATNYFLTTLFIYSLKRNFFEDSFTTLPFMTYFFSVTSVVIQWGLILILDRHYIPLTPSFIISDLFIMPLGDALFAAIIFTLPSLFFGKPVRKGSDYFLNLE